MRILLNLLTCHFFRLGDIYSGGAAYRRAAGLHKDPKDMGVMGEMP